MGVLDDGGSVLDDGVDVLDDGEGVLVKDVLGDGGGDLDDDVGGLDDGKGVLDDGEGIFDDGEGGLDYGEDVLDDGEDVLHYDDGVRAESRCAFSPVSGRGSRCTWTSLEDVWWSRLRKMTSDPQVIGGGFSLYMKILGKIFVAESIPAYA